MMKLLLALMVVSTNALIAKVENPKKAKAAFPWAVQPQAQKNKVQKQVVHPAEEAQPSVASKDKPLCDKASQLQDDGKWEHWNGREHSFAMDYGQPGCKKDAELMQFEPSSCVLPLHANEVTVRPRRTIFIGDSVQDSQAQAYAWFQNEQAPQDVKKCMHPLWRMAQNLKESLPKADFSEGEVKATTDFVKNQNKGKAWNLHEWWGCNSSVSFALADKPPPAEAVKGYMHAVRNFHVDGPLGPDDVIVMNFGLWMDAKMDTKGGKGKGEGVKIDQTDPQMKNSVKLMLEEIQGWSKTGGAPKVVWREITPSHWNSWDGYYTKTASQTTLNQCKALTEKNRALLAKKSTGLRGRSTAMFMDAAAEAGLAVDGVNIEFLPVWRAAVQQPDDHPKSWDNSGSVDCTHFCNQGTVNRFLNAALLTTMSGMIQRSQPKTAA